MVTEARPAETDAGLVPEGEGWCGILMVGRRREHEELLYPVADVARKHDAGVTQETTSGREAYAPFERSAQERCREGTLPG